MYKRQQISYADEIFQFPTLVVITKNQARNQSGEFLTTPSFNICEFKNQNFTVITLNEDNEPIESEIYFKCFSQLCKIGKTGKKAIFSGKIPQCYNGLLIAKAKGYKDATFQIKNLEPFTVNLFLKKFYNLRLNFNLNEEDERAILILKDLETNKSKTIYWPEQQEINLSEGNYEIAVKVFRKKTIHLGGKTGKCVNLPFPPFEYCFESSPPEYVEEIPFAGGRNTFTITKKELEKAGELLILVEKFPIPTNLEEIVGVYESIENAEIKILLK